MSQFSSSAKVAVLDYTKREHPDTLTYGEAVKTIPEDAEIISVAWTKFNGRKYPNVKHVINRSMGTEHLVNAFPAQIHQIDDYCSDEVAQYILDRVPEGARLLVIGRGRIGTKVAQRSNTLLIGSADFLNSDHRLEDDFDCIAVTTHLNPDTRKMFNGGTFFPRKGQILINAARAGLFDEGYLIDLLNSGALSKAYLDVASSRELQRHPSVEYTNHTAWYSPTSVERRKDRYLELVRTLL